jgi:hypothetical protein
LEQFSTFPFFHGLRPVEKWITWKTRRSHLSATARGALEESRSRQGKLAGVALVLPVASGERVLMPRPLD